MAQIVFLGVGETDASDAADSAQLDALASLQAMLEGALIESAEPDAPKPLDPAAAALIAFFNRAIDRFISQTPYGAMVDNIFGPYLSMLSGLLAEAPHEAIAQASQLLLAVIVDVAADAQATLGDAAAVVESAVATAEPEGK